MRFRLLRSYRSNPAASVKSLKPVPPVKSPNPVPSVKSPNPVSPVKTFYLLAGLSRLNRFKTGNRFYVFSGVVGADEGGCGWKMLGGEGGGLRRLKERTDERLGGYERWG